ncbi:hypothetical protein EVG20_g10713 [Dentipellis fragilis]|uniref:Uncharacterized protein n=1 Tax=Dentipellis fragilis TaxID=205917 RepID=A0A4Y9XRS0_9AGAM|nr:hypothetical protein EVG20_g10713 [Dentipellis fragilis]
MKPVIRSPFGSTILHSPPDLAPQMDLIKTLTNTAYPVVVFQFFPKGREDHCVASFRWTIQLIENKSNCSGRRIRVGKPDMNDHHGRTQFYCGYTMPDVQLRGNYECRGGIQIGTVRHRDLIAFENTAGRIYALSVRGDEQWAARGWVIDWIRLLKGKPWVYGALWTEKDFLEKFDALDRITTGFEDLYETNASANLPFIKYLRDG